MIGVVRQVFLVFLLSIMIGLGFVASSLHSQAAINDKQAGTLKHLVQDVVSHDVGDFVEQFYQAHSRLFLFLNDDDWDIKRLENGVYLIVVHIESYEKFGAFPLGRDRLTIKVDPKALYSFFREPKKSESHGIHIVRCQHQVPHVDHHRVTFSEPKEVKGQFCQ
ncbi:MAG TPA: hypothetical protein VFK33_09555 [Bacillales bacterium]|nr:hypothetical protein [Bacillales bacterium]